MPAIKSCILLLTDFARANAMGGVDLLNVVTSIDADKFPTPCACWFYFRVVLSDTIGPLSVRFRLRVHGPDAIRKQIVEVIANGTIEREVEVLEWAGPIPGVAFRTPGLRVFELIDDDDVVLASVEVPVRGPEQ